MIANTLVSVVMTMLRQAIFRKSRFWALNLVQEVETRVRHDQHQQQRQQSTGKRASAHAIVSA